MTGEPNDKNRLSDGAVRAHWVRAGFAVTLRAYLRSFLRSSTDDEIAKLSTQAKFPECPELAAKIAAARGILPRNSVKPVRKS